jgi:hypothetical protein
MDETWYRLPDNALAALDPVIVAKLMPESARGSSASTGQQMQPQAKPKSKPNGAIAAPGQPLPR